MTCCDLFKCDLRCYPDLHSSAVDRLSSSPRVERLRKVWPAGAQFKLISFMEIKLFLFEICSAVKASKHPETSIHIFVLFIVMLCSNLNLFSEMTEYVLSIMSHDS